MVSDRIFISFSSTDQRKAAAVCEALEQSGVKCWVSFRDVQPGENYQSAIVQALQSAKGMVLIFSSRTSLSQEVNKEMSLASAFKLSVIPLRIENTMPQGALHYELATRQWIDAFDRWESAIGELVRAIHSIAIPSIPGGAATMSPPVRKRADVRISEQAIEAARAALTHYIGPIALILVRKAATAADSLDDFHERLAREIQAPADRTAFLSQVRRDPRFGSSRPKA